MKTHYDVLNVDKNCTEKEIKDAFIKLSKKYHPDTNKSKDAHAKFVELNEAYSVLGKSDSRHNYDVSLSSERSRNGQNARVVYNRPSTYEDLKEFYAYQRQNHQGGRTQVFTISKLRSVFLCCLVMIIGSALQLKAEVHRRRARSQRIATALKELKDKANERKENPIKEAILENDVMHKNFQK